MKQTNLMIKNINVVDFLPSTSTISFSSNNQIFTRFFTTDIIFNSFYGSNTIINAVFNSSTLASLNNQPQQTIKISEYFVYFTQDEMINFDLCSIR
jgi:hypothetical protein